VPHVERIIAEQKTAFYRLGVVRYTLDFYRKKLKDITVDEACEILGSMACGGDAFWWGDNDTEWTPDELRTVTAEDGLTKSLLGQWAAVNVEPIKFFGGPPTRWGLGRGTLLTLLLDRITVVALLEGGKGINEIITLRRYCKERA
jgi:hypothetical protein